MSMKPIDSYSSFVLKFVTIKINRKKQKKCLWSQKHDRKTRWMLDNLGRLWPLPLNLTPALAEQKREDFDSKVLPQNVTWL
jgi:hypothetical protein